jgi:hypothetical protein
MLQKGIEGSNPFLSAETIFLAFKNKAKFPQSYVNPQNQRFAGFYFFGLSQIFQKCTKKCG